MVGRNGHQYHFRLCLYSSIYVFPSLMLLLWSFFVFTVMVISILLTVLRFFVMEWESSCGSGGRVETSWAASKRGCELTWPRRTAALLSLPKQNGGCPLPCGFVWVYFHVRTMTIRNRMVCHKNRKLSVNVRWAVCVYGLSHCHQYSFTTHIHAHVKYLFLQATHARSVPFHVNESQCCRTTTYWLF